MLSNILEGRRGKPARSPLQAQSVDLGLGLGQSASQSPGGSSFILATAREDNSIFSICTRELCNVAFVFLINTQIMLEPRAVVAQQCDFLMRIPWTCERPSAKSLWSSKP